MASGNQYPDSADIEALKKYNVLKQGVDDFIKLLASAWNSDMGRMDTHIIEDTGMIVNRSIQIELATGGWSGNEEVISALHDNEWFLWSMFWQKSERGGLHVFQFKLKKVEQ